MIIGGKRPAHLGITIRSFSFFTKNSSKRIRLQRFEATGFKHQFIYIFIVTFRKQAFLYLHNFCYRIIICLGNGVSPYLLRKLFYELLYFFSHLFVGTMYHNTFITRFFVIIIRFMRSKISSLSGFVGHSAFPNFTVADFEQQHPFFILLHQKAESRILFFQTAILIIKHRLHCKCFQLHF